VKALGRILFAAALCVAAPAFAQAQPEQGGEEIWDLSAAGAPRHWHTGLTCWSEAGNVPFTRRIAYNAAGSDVSCSYGDSGALVTLYVSLPTSEQPFDSLVAQSRQQVTERYSGARVVSDTQRTIQTSAGALEVDELTFAINGEDVRQNTHMRGSTGVWQANVGGWVLKLRLSNYTPGSAGDLPPLAEALLGRAYAEMQTARDCANAGLTQAPNLNLSGEEGIQVQVSAAAMMPAIAAAIPSTPLEARRAGFVCLGNTLIDTHTGTALVGVMPLPGDAPSGDAIILGLGEIRPRTGPATMVALVDMSMNPFGMPDARADRGHFMFAVAGRSSSFYGVLNGGALRETLAFSATHVNRGAAALVTATPPD